jgi:hypothetical protein
MRRLAVLAGSPRVARESFCSVACTPGTSEAEANRRAAVRSSLDWLADRTINKPIAQAEKKQTTSPYENSFCQFVRGGSIMPATGVPFKESIRLVTREPAA